MELSTDKVFDCGSECEREKKHDMMLDLSLNDQKTENLFAGSDQTPTPTRLIRNCEEVGLFEDLRHVNPFEETFRRACEQHNGQTPIRQLDSVEMHADEDSLHTPQVYPHLEAIQSCEMLSKPLDSPTSATVTLDVPVVDEILNAATDAYKIGTSRQNSNNSTTSSGGYGKIYKYRTIAEKPAAAPEVQVPYIQLPTTAIQFIQPQLITLTFPENNTNKTLSSNLEAKPAGVLATNAIPIQTVKPFIMPKLAPAPTTPNTKKATTQLPPLSTKTSATTTTAALTTTTSATATVASLPTPTQHEPSSASLTPTSQLPIKERLKAILSHGNKTHTAAATPVTKTTSSTRRARNSATGACKYDEDCMVRRRAAATRYRNKMRNEHKDLRRRNGELQAENEKLRARIKQLEQELAKSQQQQQQQQILQATNGALQAMPTQMQIPPSTLHLVMNIPTMVVPSAGQPSLVQPITYRVEKK
ncbi:cyclic AMP-dependent transcription factor ATF-2 [Bactrocera neohumeralis]|uniref:cyclic AMP-dependent transcription factor ATF-2 n=1 Tax=Bactrocera neohumeralis TaxID=98809 RepID=UPI00216525B7|nr:cyclic AMP-dependent transcription factor ATF-2 [Bactrocera neohumeralis]